MQDDEQKEEKPKFAVNASDDRFTALWDNPLFNIDQSSVNYRATPGMKVRENGNKLHNIFTPSLQHLVDVKVQRRLAKEKPTVEKKSKNVSASDLVSSLKQKSQLLMEKKKQREAK